MGGEMTDIINRPNLNIRSAILSLQDQILEMDGHLLAADFETNHYFAPETYGREILLKKGDLVVGKIHKHAHLNIISRGLVAVMTEEGPRLFDARERPVTFTSLPGTKRVVYAHEDTYWTTIHITKETDLCKIEGEIIAKGYDELPSPEEISILIEVMP